MRGGTSPMAEEHTQDNGKLVAFGLFPAAIAGILTAIVAGALWGYLTIFTGYELGFVAWALGGVTGIAVVMFSKRNRRMSFQVISVVSSMIGITIGKYIFFYHSVKEIFKAEYGTETANDVSIASLDLLRVFLENLGTTLSGLNILWIILALLTAWIIPRVRIGPAGAFARKVTVLN